MKKNIILLAILVLASVLTVTGTVFAEGAEPPAPPEAPIIEAPVLPDEPPTAVATAALETSARETPALENTGEEAPAEIITPEIDLEEMPGDDAILSATPQETPQEIGESSEAGIIVEEAEPAVDIVVINEEGEPLALASEEAAQELAAPDPYFTSGGTRYSFYQAAGACAGAAHCMDGLANPIQAAIEYIQANGTTPDDGSIYVEKGTYTGAVTVDGTLANMSSLTGLIGISSGGVYPTINGTLTLSGLPNNGFTLSGFNVTGGVTIQNSSASPESFVIENVTGSLTMDNVTVYAPEETGVHIKNHKGNIILNDINVGHSTDGAHGIWVENQISGNLTITDSEFRFNSGVALKLESKGIVTLDQVIVQDCLSGIEVDGFSSLTIRDTGSVGNDRYGIRTQSAGKPVTMAGILTDSNGTSGCTDCGGIYILNAGNVVLNTIRSSFTNGSGIKVTSSGKISLTDCSAEDNALSGIDLYTPNGTVSVDGVVAVTNHQTGVSIESRGATLRNIIADENYTDGIRLVLSGGSALLENIEANQNGHWGIHFDTTEIYPKAVASIILKNSFASHNGQGGIFIRSLGAVTLSNCGAYENSADDGIFIATTGAVKVSSTQAAANAGNGLQIEGIYKQGYFDGAWRNVSMTSPASVTVNFISSSQTMSDFNQNGKSLDWSLGLHGLQVISQKPVVLSNIGAHQNNGYGIYVCGPELYNATTSTTTMQRAGAVTINSLISGVRNDVSENMIGVNIFSAGAVTLADINSDSNNERGIQVDTLGAITLKNARDNNTQGSDSVKLVNTSAAGNMPVTISNLEISNTQGDSGAALLVQSKGAISINGMSIYDNRCTGAKLENDNSGKGNITVLNSNVENSKDKGIEAESNGSILFTSVRANNNGQEGVYLFNQGAATLAPISLTDCEFNRNGTSGLQAFSRGMITLKNVGAYENGDTGIALDNAVTGSKANVTLTVVSADSNNATGLVVSTNGQVQITDLATNNNAKRNGWLGNESDEGFTVQDYYNQGMGLDRWDFRAVHNATISILLRADALWPLNRADFQPVLRLYDAKTDEEISVSLIYSEGAVGFSLMPLDAGYSDTHDYYVLVGSSSNDGFYRLSRNDSDPDSVENMYFVNGANITTGGNVSIKGLDNFNNSTAGLSVTTTGNSNITLAGVSVNGNGAEGMYLTCGRNPEDWNDFGWGTGTISISGSSFSNSNGWEGLMMATSGNIILQQFDAVNNGQATGNFGIKVHEDHAAKSVTIGGLTAHNNSGGMSIRASGNITITKADISNNYGQGGLYLDNCLADEGVCSGSGLITLTNVTANDNQANGMELYSKGVITLNTVQGGSNQQNGIVVSNRYDGTSANLVFKGVFADNNAMTGVRATTNGSLLLANVNANENNLSKGGMNSGESVQDYLNKSKGSDYWFFEAEAETPYTITLLADGTNFDLELLNRMDFDPLLKLYRLDEDNNLVEITSGFTITHVEDTSYRIEWTPGADEGGTYALEATSTDSSGYYRLSINHDASEYMRYFVDGFSYEAGGSVALSGVNHFNNNEQNGLVGSSQGSVTLSNVYANGNGKEGIYVNNLGGSGGVTLGGISQTNNNGYEGLRVESNGAVSLSGLDACGNGFSGVSVIGAGAKLSLLNLSGNGVDGLNLATSGAVAIDALRAWNNKVCGAYVETNGASLTVKNSSFLRNGIYGLAYMNDPAITFTAANNAYQRNGDNYPDGRDNLVAIIP
jgi:hypothetical protein